MARLTPIVSRHVARPRTYLGPWENSSYADAAGMTRRFNWNMGDYLEGTGGGIVMAMPVRIVGITISFDGSNDSNWFAAEVGVFVNPTDYYDNETPVARGKTELNDVAGAVMNDVFHVGPIEVDAGDRIHVDLINAWNANSLAGLEAKLSTENASSIQARVSGVIALVIEH